jgi:hypothetical protein
MPWSPESARPPSAEQPTCENSVGVSQSKRRPRPGGAPALRSPVRTSAASAMLPEAWPNWSLRLRVARAARAARVAQASKMARALKMTRAAKMALASMVTRVAKVARAARVAQSAMVARIARAAQAAQVAQVALA